MEGEHYHPTTGRTLGLQNISLPLYIGGGLYTPLCILLTKDIGHTEFLTG